MAWLLLPKLLPSLAPGLPPRAPGPPGPWSLLACCGASRAAVAENFLELEAHGTSLPASGTARDRSSPGVTSPLWPAGLGCGRLQRTPGPSGWRRAGVANGNQWCRRPHPGTQTTRTSALGLWDALFLAGGSGQGYVHFVNNLTKVALCFPMV